ncbi:MAG: HNH endonuclease [Verrucomicrobia bacterium]|nr:HNH endonuclease [Verrucomicrobiota bacterium]
MPQNDLAIRLAAFDAMGRLVDKVGRPLPWSEIAKGFTFRGEVILFASKPRGIYKPKQLERGALSVKTPVPRIGRTARYDDVSVETDSFLYKFQGDDPKSRDNQWLREAWQDRSPLIYFYGVAETYYEPIWPVYVISWEPNQLHARLEAVPVKEFVAAEGLAEELERQYATRLAKQRIHQARFREIVLHAYGYCCAFSRLPIRQLLHASHIVPDPHKLGIASVQNGIALSPLHHAAFDANLLGIDSDYIIRAGTRLKSYSDGSLLERELKGLDGVRMHIPKRVEAQPSRDLLAMRYKIFEEANT